MVGGPRGRWPGSFRDDRSAPCRVNRLATGATAMGASFGGCVASKCGKQRLVVPRCLRVRRHPRPLRTVALEQSDTHPTAVSGCDHPDPAGQRRPRRGHNRQDQAGLLSEGQLRRSRSDRLRTQPLIRRELDFAGARSAQRAARPPAATRFARTGAPSPARRTSTGGSPRGATQPPIDSPRACSPTRG